MDYLTIAQVGLGASLFGNCILGFELMRQRELKHLARRNTEDAINARDVAELKLEAVKASSNPTYIADLEEKIAFLKIERDDAAQKARIANRQYARLTVDHSLLVEEHSRCMKRDPQTGRIIGKAAK